MKRLSIVGFTALAISTASSAHAQPAYPTIHRHLGLYLNLDLGFGYLGSSASAGGIDVKLSGAAGQFSLALGGAVQENFILAGRVWGYSAESPSVTVSGQSFAGGSSTLDLTGFGLDLTYYFMPTNLYLSATPSITSLSVKEGGQTFSTENGFGLRLALGKEWWVSDHWGIGLDGNLAFASNKDKGAGAPTWGSFAFSVAFSATYN